MQAIWYLKFWNMTKPLSRWETVSPFNTPLFSPDKPSGSAPAPPEFQPHLRHWHVAWSVCLSVCVSVIRMSCEKMVEPIKMPFDGWLERGPVNHVLDEVKIGQIHSQLREVISRRCVLSPKYSGQLLFNRSFFSKLKCAASSVENQQVLRFLWFYQKCQYIKWCSKDEKHESLKVGEGKTIKYTLVDSDVISSFLYMPAVLAAIM